jgi:signal transduction histidine kinase
VRIPHPTDAIAPGDLRRQTERLDGLPLRPSTARLVLDAYPDPPEDLRADPPAPSPLAALGAFPLGEIDPGWVLAQMRAGATSDPLAVVAGRPWWPVPLGHVVEAVQRLWRHAVAVGHAARRLARDAGDPDPDRLARVGLLHGLGRWALAAVDPRRLAQWLAEGDPRRRRALEDHWLGTDLTALGRTLAERWGCDPLVVDAAWLHADRDGALNGCASDPRRLALIQEAFAWGERTPWALLSSGTRAGPASEPALRGLIAEVQARCGSAFVEPDATPHEARRARSCARLRRRFDQRLAVASRCARLLDALAEGDPSDSPQVWAERAGRAWHDEPGVAAARVVWTAPGASPEGAASPGVADPGPAVMVVPLWDRGRLCAEIQLSPGSSHPELAATLAAIRPAWQAWAALVAERARLDQRLATVVAAYRLRVADEETRLGQAKLAALAEFAAGAGHELNNPLAVIVGRAQLLLARESDAATVRSLRAILGQAQRAHRILRDLMAVARPPELRPRLCQPDEVIRACLRDAQPEAEARGVQLVVAAHDSGPRVWADPDALRHIAEVLLRNALEALPPGGTIRVSAEANAQALSWTFQDNGRGIAAGARPHLFDPFYCGRQAGRGLGLGLSRAARIVAQAGGALHWHSTPGQGATFRVDLPLAEPPGRAPADPSTGMPSPSNGSPRPSS